MTANFVDGDDMIGIVLRLEIEDQWWKPKDPERGRAENTAIETGSCPFMEDLAW